MFTKLVQFDNSSINDLGLNLLERGFLVISSLADDVHASIYCHRNVKNKFDKTQRVRQAAHASN